MRTVTILEPNDIIYLVNIDNKTIVLIELEEKHLDSYNKLPLAYNYVLKDNIVTDCTVQIVEQYCGVYGAQDHYLAFTDEQMAKQSIDKESICIARIDLCDGRKKCKFCN